MSTGALATLSGAKTGRCLRDKCVVKDESTEQELWWRNGSPNIEIDEQSQQTFMVNKETAVEYLNSLEWVGFLNVIIKQFMNGSALVFVNDQFINWDPENRIKVWIVSAQAYHSLFMH
ncbi:hypothetical protein ACLB2K_006168 [Fragaria x ananassa]